MNNTDHIEKQHKKMKRNRRRFMLFVVLCVAIISGFSALLVPLKEDNILFAKNSHHKYNYPESLTIEEVDGQHFESTIISADGSDLASVKTYFLVDGADQKDLLNQFYPSFFSADNVGNSLPTYQFQNRYVTMSTYSQSVVNVFEYDINQYDKVIDFAGQTIAFTEPISELQEFTPNQYRDILNHVVYDESVSVTDQQLITGNEEVDSYIINKAQERGYKQRVQINVTTLAEYSNIKISTKIKDSLDSLIKSALEVGHSIETLSGYRSIEDQKFIFNSRYLGGKDTASVESGLYDAEIDRVLETTAPPGMSKHHSSYTVDFAKEGVFFTEFKNTDSFKWLSENNYENAKKFGFVPSYPEGADDQGPNPEAWEYTYVGKDILLK